MQLYQSYILIAIISLVQCNDRPVIGIFTIPSGLANYPSLEYSFIGGSYVKQMEAAGAMVVPVSWEADYNELDYLMENLNGILFTGGDSAIYLDESSPGYSYNKLTDTASYLFMKALQQNQKGRYFPIMGTCQGFQLLHYIASQYYPVLSAVTDDLGYERLLQFTDTNSQIFNNLNADLRNYITNINGPFYSHNWGVLPSTYQESNNLNEFFQITSLSQDGAGVPYIATAEGKNYPIFAFQFHSEKHAFEWKSKADHDPMHIIMGQYVANEFIARARMSENKFDDEQLIQRIIYNHSPAFVWQTTTFVQIYPFVRNMEDRLKPAVQLGIKMVREWDL